MRTNQVFAVLDHISLLSDCTKKEAYNEMKRDGQHLRAQARTQKSIALLVLLLLLLVLPLMATMNLPWHPYFSLGYMFIISVVTFATYTLDKELATADMSRLSEKSLHLLELIGGWPGALLAQHFAHHKTSKLSFQLRFWLIVLAYQVIALEVISGWLITQRVFSGLAEKM